MKKRDFMICFLESLWIYTWNWVFASHEDTDVELNKIAIFKGFQKIGLLGFFLLLILCSSSLLHNWWLYKEVVYTFWPDSLVFPEIRHVWLITFRSKQRLEEGIERRDRIFLNDKRNNGKAFLASFVKISSRCILE